MTNHAGARALDADKNFPTSRRPEYRPLSAADLPDLATLDRWANEVGLTIGSLADSAERRRLAIGAFWNWKDIHQDSAALPLSDLIEYRLTMSPETVPHATPYRRHLSPDDARFFHDTCTEGLLANMYERTPPHESLSRWDAPPVIVLKASGDKRLTFNYQNVKRFEVLPSVHLQSLQVIRNVLSGPDRPFKGRGDFKSAYWSIPVAEESRHILSFFCPGLGQLRPTRAPQGCGGSGLVLAEAVNRLFGPIPPPNAEPTLFSDSFNAYQDDSFFAHSTFEDHLSFINDRYLPRIRWSRFSVSFKKFEAFTPVLDALGVRHSFDQILIKPGRLDALLAWKVPETRQEVMAWLGAINFCVQNIKNAEGLLRPIRDLLNVPDRNRGRRSKRDFVWTPTADAAWREVKAELAKETPLDGLDPALPVHLYVDASDEHGGLVLLQPKVKTKPGVPILSQDEYRLIRFDSFSFTKTERNYSTFKRELRVIIFAITKYNHMLNGTITSTIFTDHRPLLGFQTAVSLHHGIYSRWATLLNETNTVLAYIPGEKNLIADGLSRSLYPTPSLNAHKTTDTLTHALTSQWAGEERAPGPPSNTRLIQISQSPYATDEEYREVFTYLALGSIPARLVDDRQALRRFKYSAARFLLHDDGRLFRRISDSEIAECVLSSEVPLILQRSHDAFGHWNHHTVVRIVKDQKLWWPHMVQDAEDFVLTCLECFKFAPQLPPDVLQRSLPSAPFVLVGLDFIDMPEADDKSKHILHLIDYFTRYSQTWHTVTAKAEDVIRCLTDSFRHFPVPHVLYHDGGKHFTSGETQKFLADLGVHCIQAPVAHSRAAGMVERGNGVLQKVLRKLANEKTDWTTSLAAATRAMNLRIVSAHGFTPYQLLFGYQPSIRTEASSRLLSMTFPSYPADQDHDALMHMLTRDEANLRAFETMEASYPGPSRPERRFSLGDLVWVFTDPPSSAKLVTRWRGPFVITEASARTYRLAHIWSDKPMPGRFDVHHLKLFHQRPKRLGDTPPLIASKTLRNPPTARVR